jgi:DNA-binding NarL/FixJ family response regulator
MSRQPTPRELEVLRVYLRRSSAKEAGHEMGLAESTVRNHLSRLYLRLDVDCATQAAIALGWLTVPV